MGALKDRDAVSNAGEEEKGTEKETKMGAEIKDTKSIKEKTADKTEEISPELKIKLRRLDKLEPKYQGGIMC